MLDVPVYSCESSLVEANPGRLLVLGLLADGPMHGHRIRRAAELAQIERWENVKVGALYGMLKRLAGEGLIEPVRSEQEGRFPVRTVYAITEEGRLELALQRERALTTPDLRSRAVEIALTWSAGLAPEELRDQLGRRRATLEAMLADERARRDAESRKGSLRPAASAGFRRTELRLEAELCWHDELDELLPRIVSRP
jgi:DNA-binding PadR family transcriptional regulator